MEHVPADSAEVEYASQPSMKCGHIQLPLHQKVYLLDGVLRQWEGSVIEVYSPCSDSLDDEGRPLLAGSIPAGTPDSAREALEAACRAYAHGRGPWPSMPVGERIAAVERFAAALLLQRDDIICLLMWEIGKTHPEAVREFDRTVTMIQGTIEALTAIERSSAEILVRQGIIGQIRRSPLGVTLCMGPFNFPLFETFSTLIPALIMGNTTLLKPPRFGVLLFYPLLEAFRDCFPPGVINTVYGDGEIVIPPLMVSGDIDVLAFIGTSRIADRLRGFHPRPHRLRCVLGLDAKNPAIILPDADLELAVSECLSGSLTFNGQRCTALKMIFVHRTIADDFLEKMSVGIGRLRCGMPWEEGVTVTPLPEPEKPAYLTGLVDDAVQHGARIINPGGGTVAGQFFYPALLYPVASSMRLYTEEQFGPVIPVVPFDQVQEVIDSLVLSDYGQQASIFGRSAAAIAPVLDALLNQVCRININSQCQRSPDSFPFNGRKSSAEGTQSIADALRVFSLRTVVASRDTHGNRHIINDILRDTEQHFLSGEMLMTDVTALKID